MVVEGRHGEEQPLGQEPVTGRDRASAGRPWRLPGAGSITAGEKAELVAYLRSLGATDAQLTDAEASCHLSGLGSDLVFNKGCDLTAEEVARRLSVRTEDVIGIWRTLGVAIGSTDEPTFTVADVDLMRMLLSVDLFDLTHRGELLRVVGNALSRVADAAIASYVQDVETGLTEGGATPTELAKMGATAAAKALELGNGLGTIFPHHLRDAVRRQRATQAQVDDPAAVRIAVGFVDLVGFTPASRRMGTRELSSFVSEFERRAFAVAADCGGRIVKHIGDEVMFIAIEAVAGCRLALALMQEFGADGIQPRGGLSFGDVVTRQGDYYGSVVNLASRLTDMAIPGEVLVDTGVASAARDEGLRFERSGRRQLKGFDDPVSVFSLEPADPA